MKYFTMEFWEKMNDSSLEKRKIAEEQWEKFARKKIDEAYKEYLKRVEL